MKFGGAFGCNPTEWIFSCQLRGFPLPPFRAMPIVTQGWDICQVLSKKFFRNFHFVLLHGGKQRFFCRFSQCLLHEP